MLLLRAAGSVSYFMSLVMIYYTILLSSVIMSVHHTWLATLFIIKGPSTLKLIFILFETRYLLERSKFYMCHHQDNLQIYLPMAFPQCCLMSFETVCTYHHVQTEGGC
jgi:hypothetical protein